MQNQYDLSITFVLLMFYLFWFSALGLRDFNPDLLLSNILLLLVERLRSYRFLTSNTKFSSFPNKFSSLF